MNGSISFDGSLSGSIASSGMISGTITPDHGSTVEIEPTLTTGTKIADYEIDGVAGELYAPTGGGSEVEITPTLATGTKIADYEIDGVAGEIYSPTPVTSYNDLTNKPSINNVTLQGNMTINEVPAFTSADNGKVLGVDNNHLEWINSTGSGGIVELARNATFWGRANTTITLNDSIDNYDLLLFCLVYRSNPDITKFPFNIVRVADFKECTDRYYAYYATGGYTDLQYIDSTTVKLLRINGDVRLQAIYGIKIGSSSASLTAGYGVDISNNEISIDHYVSGDTFSKHEDYVPALITNSKKRIGFNICVNKPLESVYLSTLNYLSLQIYDKTTDTTTTVPIVVNGTINPGYNVDYMLTNGFNGEIKFIIDTVDPYPAFDVDTTGTYMIAGVDINISL